MDFFYKLRERYKKIILSQYLKRIKRGSSSAIYGNPASKTVLSTGATMSLDSKTEALKEVIRDKAKQEILRYLKEPEKFLDYLKKNGAIIHRTKYANAILSRIDEQEGFIVGQEGFYALKLNFLLSVFALQPFSLGFKTKPMFILNDGEIDIFGFSEHFYKYLAMNFNHLGLEFKVQKKISRINKYAPDNNDIYAKIPLDELLALKEGIKINLDAVNFATELTKEYKTSKKAFDKLQNQNGTSV